MDASSVSTRSHPGHGALPRPHLVKGLALLRDALEDALAVGRGVWEFAVELDELRAAGLSNANLRWLLCQGYVMHGQEQPPMGSCHRSFQPIASLSLPPCSCFVLTDSGRALLKQGS